MGHKMGHKSKNLPGEISITNHKGRIRLRWRVNTERYSLNLPYSYTDSNLHHATVKVTEIKLDILKGCFDPSLEKYKEEIRLLKPKKQVEQPKEATSKHELLKQLVPRFNFWTKHIRNIDIDNSFDYLYTRRLLEKQGNLPVDEIVICLNRDQVAPTTFNRRLGFLKSFLTWLQNKSEITYNPLADVSRRKVKKKVLDRRKPLSEDEILSFLNAIQENTYCPSNSRFKHAHYYPFFLFIFYTGVRNAEAVGLRVKHINLTANTVEISETFARSVKGTSHVARIRKETKTDNVRYLPLNEELRLLLIKQIKGRKEDDFVFPSPRGMCIDDHMLQRRIYKPVMKALGFGDKDLYAARHSFGTRSIQQGISVTDTAYALGHSTIETAVRTYVHVEKPTTALPSISRKVG
ncbi:site-specific integrase [Chitinophaga sp. MM2321]|uniref:tyrosine-type recombinase/integrase n=1 Tax=Chitinophaga sp. MM2321 TaxID=3137178 RepID=UPI0032D5946D